MLEVCWEALENAGIPVDQIQGQEVKFAVSMESPNPDLQKLIESFIESSLVATAIANICWQIGRQNTIENNGQQTLLFTSAAVPKNNRQIFLAGLGQLYVLGVVINWQVLGEVSGGKNLLAYLSFPEI